LETVKLNQPIVIGAAVVVGVGLIVVAVVYWVEPAGSLPAGFLGTRPARATIM
jgi:hypothetical protein